MIAAYRQPDLIAIANLSIGETELCILQYWFGDGIPGCKDGFDEPDCNAIIFIHYVMQCSLLPPAHPMRFAQKTRNGFFYYLVHLKQIQN